MEIELFRDKKMKDTDLEIGILVGEIQHLLDLLEDLREAILCKPSQYQRLVRDLEKQIEEVYFRAGYLINLLKKEAWGDQQ
jgi:hypothetical protein